MDGLNETADVARSQVCSEALIPPGSRRELPGMQGRKGLSVVLFGIRLFRSDAIAPDGWFARFMAWR
jgi:hypothetical protein